MKGFPCGLAGKEFACDAGDLGSIPGLGRSPGEGKGYPLQYSGLDNSMDCTVHGVAKKESDTTDFHFKTICPQTLYLFPYYIHKSASKNLVKGLPWWSSA